jgi:hypothetical protein
MTELPTIQPDKVILSLASGRNVLFTAQKSERDEDALRTTTQGGLIYEHRGDMPSLEELFAELKIASAVIERSPIELSPGRIVTASALAAAITAVGFALIAVDLFGGAHPNPYVSLMMALGGLALFATIFTALRTRTNPA